MLELLGASVVNRQTVGGVLRVMYRSTWPLCLLIVVVFVCQTMAADGEYTFRLPEGFTIEQVAGPPAIQFPMFAALDDRGRLFVAESSGLDLYDALQKLTRKCRISVLEDRDGDGRYEHSRVFVDQLVFPMGLVWRDGKLYVCDPPEVVSYEDRGGAAGPREVVLNSFGHTDNGSLHGLEFGPDGLLYGTLGSPDGYRIARADGTVVTGTTGILFRCRSDGTHPEVLAHGFTNLVEIGFWPTGEIFGANTWYQEPANGLRDSLVHIVDGGFYPYWEESGENLPVSTGRRLPALTMFPASACSGMCRILARQLPDAYHDNLVVAQFNTRNVTRHVLSRDGSTFRAENSDFLTTDDPDFRPADVLEDADGSLLVLDTGSWYVQHCPTGGIRQSAAQGAIYRIRYSGAARLSDPWGLDIDFQRATPEQLAALLSDARVAVRQRAQQTLVQRGDRSVNALTAVLRRQANAVRSKVPNEGGVTRADDRAVAARHAIWALSAIGSDQARASLREILNGEDPELTALAARAVARCGDEQAAPRLTALLQHAQAHVRMAAAEALAHCGDAAAVPALIDALTSDLDPMLQHMLVFALSATADRTALQAALEHAHPRVQQAALVLLNQPPHESLSADQVVLRASAADGELRSTAQSILQQRPEWGTHVVALIRQLMEQIDLTESEQGALRSYILAFQSDPSVIALVAQALSWPSERLSDARRILLLEALSGCSLVDVPESWATALGRDLQHANADVRSQTVRTLAVLEVPQLDDQLARIAESTEQPTDMRIEALRAVIRRRPTLNEDQFALLLSEFDTTKTPLARLVAGQVLSEAQLETTQFARLVDVIRHDPVISPTVALASFERSPIADVAPELFGYLVESVQQSWILPDRQVQLVIAALPVAQQAEAVRQLAAARQSIGDQAALLDEYQPLAEGGSADRGRTLYFGKATCSTCHRVGNEGGVIGPDLTKVGAIRTARDLVESLVVPSATIAQRYETYTVITDAGRVFTGVLARQTPELVVLHDASGAELRIRTDTIDEMEMSKRSIMPETTIKTLVREEVRDLLAFLQSLK